MAKIIRDPIHNIIDFDDSECSEVIFKLIDTKEFQRLRRIRQLGMADLVFPGASHSRFVHSIGTMHISRRFVAAIRPQLTGVSQRVLDSVPVAALLHDIGHGPFSHAFEKITKQDHEALGKQIILSDETEVNRILRQYGADFPELIVSLIDKDFEVKELEGEVPKYLKDIISSQLDADRFDYLLRDSHATGTIYGKFDYDWLLKHICVDTDKERLYFNKKALSAAEAYLFARHHMYQSVYFHKTIRSAEVMLKNLFIRFKELIEEERLPKEKDRLVPGVPSIVMEAFRTDLNLQNYLKLDEAALCEFFKCCSLSEDEVLSRLGRGLIERKLFKCIDLSYAPPEPLMEFAGEVKSMMQNKKLVANYMFSTDTAGDVPYQPYEPDVEVQPTQIFIEDNYGNRKEIASLAPALSELKIEYSTMRYFFPEEVRSDVMQIYNKCFVGGES